MASWSEILQDKADTENMFSETEAASLTMEEKIDLLIAGMMKLQKTVDTRFNAINSTLNDEDKGVILRIKKCEETVAENVNKTIIDFQTFPSTCCRCLLTKHVL